MRTLIVVVLLVATIHRCASTISYSQNTAWKRPGDAGQTDGSSTRFWDGNFPAGILDTDTGTYSYTCCDLKDESNKRQTRTIWTRLYGFAFEPEYALRGVTVKIKAATDDDDTYHYMENVTLSVNPGCGSTTYVSPTVYGSTDDSFNHNAKTFTYGDTTDTWGITNWPISYFSDSCFKVNYQHHRYYGWNGVSRTYDVQVRVSYTLSLTVSQLIPNTITTNFNTMPTTVFYVQGNYFKPIFGSTTPKCKIGNVVVDGAFVNATHLQCTLPTMPQYTQYSVSVSLDQSKYTNDPLTFTYVCDPQSLCSGHGSCSTTGSCTCNTGWGGSKCDIFLCGNGLLDDGEACDDGNAIANDGCTGCQTDTNWTCNGAPSKCRNCGDGIVQSAAGEVCDDGNRANGDGCSSTCLAVETNWTCSSGNPSICNNCGDGQFQSPEICDDGNKLPADGCSPTCTIESGFNCTGFPSKCMNCGDGKIQVGETCDEGGSTPSGGCVACTSQSGWSCPTANNLGGLCSTVCGDGLLRGSEICDDNNTVNTDGCFSNCTVTRGWNCTNVNINTKTVCHEVCGNGIVTQSEGCDDANSYETDGCRSNCTVVNGWTCSGSPSNCSGGCGDSVTNPPEQCDDGNTNQTDGCPSTCVITPGWNCSAGNVSSVCNQVCGNGITTISEECDDGNQNNLDGCSSSCQIEAGFNCTGQPSNCWSCPNGHVESPIETCDDNNTDPNDGCDASCRIVTGYTCTQNETNPVSFCFACGNAKIEGRETCDDNNTNSGDGCSSTCQIEYGYSCNNTNATTKSVCFEVCGNGIVTISEGCDDNNTVSNDGCSSDCAIEFGWSCTFGQDPTVCVEVCGNYFTTKSEQCDDGGDINGDGCDSNCLTEVGWNCTLSGLISTCEPICGDGLIKGSEACDDNNLVDNDGCSSTCTLEMGWDCVSAPGDRTHCTSRCGDGHLVGTEQCDDNNAAPLDGCFHCTIEPAWNCTAAFYDKSNCFTTCGDGMRTGMEDCDDGNTDNGDGCSVLCKREVGWICSNDNRTVCVSQCGDGKITTLEACDDGNLDNLDGCSGNCVIEDGWTCYGVPSSCTSVCGDSILSLPEQCDDGNDANGDGCSSVCKLEVGWTCIVESEGNLTCIPNCGDGRRVGFESCDDGNRNPGDGCSPDCQNQPGWVCTSNEFNQQTYCRSVCGDGIVVNGEECDSLADTDGCTSDCSVVEGWVCLTANLTSNCREVCGDGLVTISEQCDDGNLAPNDGCSPTCTIEKDWICESNNITADNYTFTQSRSNCTFIGKDAIIAPKKTDNTTTILAIVFPILGVLIASFIAAVVLAWRKKYKLKKLKKPNFQEIAFGKDFTEEAPHLTPEQKEALKAIEDLILDPHMRVLGAICDTTPVTEADKVAKSLIYVYHKHSKALQAMMYRTAIEIQLAESENTLFRGNSMASKMFNTYCKMVGLEYLWETLGLVLYELNELSKGENDVEQPSIMFHTTSMEVDPNRLDENEDAFTNQLQLKLFAHKLWKTIITSEKKVPRDFKELFNVIATELPTKFNDPTSTYKGVGGFFFLRLICPAITNPHVYGLLPAPPAEASQRALILLSKILQNISNGTLPGKKESYMETLNEFIQTHISEGVAFLERLSNPDIQDNSDVELLQVPSNVYDNSLVYLAKHMKLTESKLQKSFQGLMSAEEFTKQLHTALQQLDF